MKLLKKLLASILLIAVISGVPVEAQPNHMADANGNGYVESRGAPTLTPAIALGSIAVIAVVALAVQNAQGHSGHSSHL